MMADCGGNSMGVNRAGSRATAKRSRLPRRIIKEAAHWVLLLSSDDVRAEDRQRFEEWLRADPRHAAEFQVQEKIWLLAGELRADVHARRREGERLNPERRVRWVWAGAGLVAASAALIGVAWIAGWLPSAQTTEYATRTAETRTVRLPDGSVAVLNTRTRLQWFRTERERRGRLLDGEAFFRVAHDGRPFRVVMDQATIEAVGTQFDVYRKADGRVRVTVLEGAVQVTLRGADGAHPIWERRIEAHQQIEYEHSRIVDNVRRATDEDLLWRQGTVSFQQQPLGQVVDELQRYTDRPISITDPELARIAVGGVYSTQDIRADLERIARFVPMVVVVQEHEGAITLQPRQPESPSDQQR
jgi:transmembrane sensor